MSVSNPHPQYAARKDEWIQMRDSAEGEQAIKRGGQKYLPATVGMVLDGMETATQPGAIAYNAYRTRARYPSHVEDGVEAALGVMHHKPPEIQLPAALEPMRLASTIGGESLEMLLRRINQEQLITGRLGLHADPIDGAPAGVPPMIVMYPAESILNWDEGQRQETEPATLNLVVLDESGFVRKADFSWEHERSYRVLVLGDPLENEASTQKNVYRMGVFKDQQSFSETGLTEPSMAGRKAETIPFVFCNTKDITSVVDKPPLLGLSDTCLAIYRGEADYRQALFMQGQDTLVVVGGAEGKTWRTGAGAVINLPSGQGHEAKFIGVESQGLSEMREALENLEKQAGAKAGQLFEADSAERESGEALKIRVAARTATLNQIALTGAFALQELLKKIAIWMGANPEEVVVTPNLDFVDESLDGKTLVDYMSARTLGLPLSLLSIHTRMKEKGLTSFTFEEEVAQMIKETDLMPAPPGAEEEEEEEEDDPPEGEE